MGLHLEAEELASSGQRRTSGKHDDVTYKPDTDGREEKKGLNPHHIQFKGI